MPLNVERPRAMRRWGLGMVVAAFVVQWTVIWSVHFPGQYDALNHLARHYLESQYLCGNPLPPYYEIHYRILPNLGGDMTIPFLMRVWQPLTALKVFLSFAIVLYWLGPAVFILQQGRGRASAFLASLLLLPLNFSPTFLCGFLNYYSGLGLAFLVLAHFIHLNRKPRPGVVELAAHSFLVVLLFFWHLAALVVYGVLAGCYFLSDVASRRQDWKWNGFLWRLAAFGLPMLPALVLLALYMTTGQSQRASENTFFQEWAERGVVNVLSRKAFGLVLWLFRSYDTAADLIVMGLWGGEFLAFFGSRPFRRPLSWLHLGILALAAAYLIIPCHWRTTDSPTVARYRP